MTEPITIPTARGDVQALWDAPAESPRLAAILVGGGDGGFDGPAEALYPTLADDLTARGIGTLRLDFRIHRFPNDVDEGVHDLLAGLAWLEERGVEVAGLAGHSFGGAVVIEAAAQAPSVGAVVTLATQTAGAQRVALVAPRPLLLIHGLDDVRLSPRCSELLYGMAGEPKSLVLIPGATHSLRQAREQVRTLVRDFLVGSLR